MTKELSGKPVASLINKATTELIKAYSLIPRMLLIQVGDDPASQYYVQSIITNGKKLGCETTLLNLPGSTTEQELQRCIQEANVNPEIHGIMIQKPLPRHISDFAINTTIAPHKDLDAIHPYNLGLILQDGDGFLPCTPAAVYFLMRYYAIDSVNGHTVILGRSNVVGKPLANMLLWKRDTANATVTVCHSRTPDLAEFTSKADILIAAIGKANYVQANMVKENCILIDVGINELPQPDGTNRFVGDIDFNSCSPKALAITPVPGGIGRITTSVLYLNLVKANLMAIGYNKTIDEYIDLIFHVKQNDI